MPLPALPAPASLAPVPGWTIAEWPLREQPGELAAELYEADAALHAEASPDDPRVPLDAELAWVRGQPAHVGGVLLVARDGDGAIAGSARCTWEDLDGVDHALSAQIGVLPGHRRQGLGITLLERSVVVAEARGRRLVHGRTRDSVPAGQAFCRRLGAQSAQVMRESRLDLAAVDRALVGRWIAEGRARAVGYRLLRIEGVTPPGLTEQVAAAYQIMNTAPRDDLDRGDVTVTPELVRDYERAEQAAGMQRWAYYAAEQASGRFVGVTDIYAWPAEPDRVHVGATAVDPAHRGRGLGKWLKAEMTALILERLPGVRWVITGNATSNDAMLAINRELGFRPATAVTTWQIGTEQLRASLAAVRPEPGGGGALTP
jgi:mycothiol synthase